MDTTVPAISAKHEVEKAQMRKWVVTSILDSERGYVNMLDVLLQVSEFYKEELSSSFKTSFRKIVCKTKLKLGTSTSIVIFLRNSSK